MSALSDGETLLSLADVRRKVRLGTTTIYERMRAGTFPRSLNLGGRLVRWKASAIDEWIAGLPEHQIGAAPGDRGTRA